MRMLRLSIAIWFATFALVVALASTALPQYIGESELSRRQQQADIEQELKRQREEQRRQQEQLDQLRRQQEQQRQQSESNRRSLGGSLYRERY